MRKHNESGGAGTARILHDIARGARGSCKFTVKMEARRVLHDQTQREARVGHPWHLN